MGLPAAGGRTALRSSSALPHAGRAHARRAIAVELASMTDQAVQETRATIRPRPPYDFDLTGSFATYGGGRYGADVFEAGAYTRLLDIRGQLVLATVRSVGTVDAPQLYLTVRGHRADRAVADEATQIFERMLGAADDLEPFYRMAERDSVLAPIVRGLRGLHVPRSPSAFEALVLAILGQQISTHVARMLRTLLIETLGPSISIDGETYQAFPRPQDIERAGVEALRLIKFSSRKAEYVVGIASQVDSGRLDVEGLRELPDRDVVAALTGLRGVGPWTANWILIRAFGRPDGFPAGDLALQRTLGVLVNEGGVNNGEPMSESQALEYSARWAPFRSYATTYLFAAARSGRLVSGSSPPSVGP